MEAATARRRAATAAIVASGLALAGYAYQVLVLPRLLGDPDPGVTRTPAPGELAVWMHASTGLSLLLMAGIPLAGAALLLSSHEGRRLVGIGVTAAFALPATLTLPSQLFYFPVFREMTAIVSKVLYLGYVAAAAAALVLIVAATAGDHTIGWTDPRRTQHAALRLVLVAAIVIAAIAHLAPPVASEQGTVPWAGGMFSGGIMPSLILRQFASLVLPLIGVVVVGVAAAGARPLRVGAAAAAVIAAHEIATVVGTPIWVAVSGQMWGHEQQLTVWYWVHVAAVVVLAASIVGMWREGRQSLPRASTRPIVGPASPHDRPA